MAGLVTVTTPVTGTPIASTTFGIPVATNLGVLANPPLAKLRNSVGQSIANNTGVALTWDTEDVDSVGGHSTVTNTSRYTCQTGYPGWYQVTACVCFTGNATGTAREIYLEVNGTAVSGSSAHTPPPSAQQIAVITSTPVELAVGDFVEAWVLQDSGGALLTNPSAFPRRQCFMTVEWIHQ